MKKEMQASSLVNAHSLSAMLDQLNVRTYLIDETVTDVAHLVRGALDAGTISLDEFRTLMGRCATLQLELQTLAITNAR